jgi:hypothetical protein
VPRSPATSLLGLAAVLPAIHGRKGHSNRVGKLFPVIPSRIRSSRMPVHVLVGRGVSQSAYSARGGAAIDS